MHLTSHIDHNRLAQYSTAVLEMFLNARSKGLNHRDPSAAPRVKALRYTGRPAACRWGVRVWLCVVVVMAGGGGDQQYAFITLVTTDTHTHTHTHTRAPASSTDLLIHKSFGAHISVGEARKRTLPREGKGDDTAVPIQVMPLVAVVANLDMKW